MLGFLYRMLRAAMLDAGVYEEVEADRSATWQALVVVLLSSLAAGLGASGIQGPSWPTQLAISGVALLTWTAWAMLVLQIGARVMPERRTRTDIGQLLRTVGFAATPGFLQVFAMQPPLAVPVFAAAWLWMFAAMVIAIRQALDYRGTGRAIAVTAVALGVVLVLVLLLSETVGAGRSREPSAGADGAYITLTSTDFGRACSDFGMCTCSTPSLNSASTFC